MTKDFVPAKVIYIGDNGTARSDFTIGNEYDAYLLEYQRGVRNILHVRNNYGIIVDHVPLNEIKVVSDPSEILQFKEAVVIFITQENKFPKLKYGKQYRAIGCDKDGYYLVEDDSRSCFFYESSHFKIKSDPDDILSHETVYSNIFWDEFNEIVKHNKVQINRDTGEEEVYVRLITGESTYINKRNVVGHCVCRLHPGTLTKTLVKNHECDIKNCCWLNKYEDNPYWKNRETARIVSAEKKETAKKLKREHKEREANLINWARNLAESMYMPIKVTSVRKEPGKKKYIIFYISNEPYNDSHLYTTLAYMFEWLVGGKTELRHVKDIDGYYATF